MKQQIVVYYYNNIYWYFNGKMHRDNDLPTYYHLINNKELYSVFYYQHGDRHRTNGPAYINYKNKIKQYWYQYREYSSFEEMQMMEACK